MYHLGDGEGVAQVETSIHIWVGECGHELVVMTTTDTNNMLTRYTPSYHDNITYITPPLLARAGKYILKVTIEQRNHNCVVQPSEHLIQTVSPPPIFSDIALLSL